MKKIFVDVYLSFNLGDDLFLDILAKKFPNYQFTINYLGKNYDPFISKYDNVNRRKYTFLNKIGQRLKISDHITNYNQIAEEHDALVFIGGSIFREEEYHSSLYKDRLNMVQEFNKRSKPVFILGANFGPYNTEEFLNDYKEFFKLCHDVCFRDLYSYNLFQMLPQVRYAPDIVFQMEVDQYKQEVNKKNTVGFSIIDVRHKQGLSKYHNDYINSSVKSIELLVNKGFECCFLSFCEKEGDLQIINQIISYLPQEIMKNVSIYEYKGDLKEAISRIASFKSIIAARFHANVLALKLGIGVMPIIYSDKTTNMLKDIHFDGTLIYMDQVNLQCNENVLNRSFDSFVNMDSISNEAKKQFEKLEQFLGS